MPGCTSSEASLACHCGRHQSQDSVFAVDSVCHKDEFLALPSDENTHENIQVKVAKLNFMPRLACVLLQNDDSLLAAGRSHCRG